jgi:hypothetical protein
MEPIGLTTGTHGSHLTNLKGGAEGPHHLHVSCAFEAGYNCFVAIAIFAIRVFRVAWQPGRSQESAKAPCAQPRASVSSLPLAKALTWGVRSPASWTKYTELQAPERCEGALRSSETEGPPAAGDE